MPISIDSLGDTMAYELSFICRKIACRKLVLEANKLFHSNLYIKTFDFLVEILTDVHKICMLDTLEFM